MKIYFATAVIGDRSNIEDARAIADLLEKKGHEILTKHLFRDDAFKADGIITPQEVFERDVRWLEEADVILIDATGSGFGIGFEAGFVLGKMNKPVFLFYNKKYSERISRMARGLTHERATVFAYSGFEDLKEFVEKNFDSHAAFDSGCS